MWTSGPATGREGRTGCEGLLRLNHGSQGTQDASSNQNEPARLRSGGAKKEVRDGLMRWCERPEPLPLS